MSLLDQPLELLIHQLLLLDIDTILSLRLVSIVLYRLCSGELLWRDKTRRDYPRYSLPDGESYRVTYLLLSRLSFSSIVKRDRRDLVDYLISNKRFSLSERVVEQAVVYRAKKVLEAMLPHVREMYIVYSAVQLAIERGDLEILELFSPRWPLINWVTDATEHGQLHILERMLGTDARLPDSFFDCFHQLLFASEKRRENLRRSIRWLRENGHIDPRDETNANVAETGQLSVLDDPTHLAPHLAAYVYLQGDRESRRQLIDYGIELSYVYLFSVDRMKLLVEEGVRAERNDVLETILLPEKLLDILDSRIAEPSFALAALSIVLHRVDEEFWSRLETLRIPIYPTEIMGEIYQLRHIGYEIGPENEKELFTRLKRL